MFDGINSDLSKYPIAYAVAASAAVPVVMHQVTLRDYSTIFERYRHLVDGGVEPIYRAEELRESDVVFDERVGADVPSVLIELASPGEPSEYLVGLQNFYVLTRYNRSSFYAAAVLSLAEAVKAAYGKPR